MKTTSFILAGTILVVASTHAQSFVTGFDFNNLQDTETVGDFNANFGGTASQGNPERNWFTLHTENSSYAFDTDPYSGQVPNAGSGWWQAGDSLGIGGDADTAGVNNIHTIRGSIAGAGASPSAFTQGNVNVNGQALHATGAVDGGWFSFGIDGSASGVTSFTDFRFDFTSLALNADFQTTQNWYLIGATNVGDIANGNFANALQSGTFAPTENYADYGFNLGTVDSGSFLVFEISTLNVDEFTVGPDSGIYYDNMTFNGSPVPEPSTFAAIAGAFALGCAVWRRRKRV